MTGIERLREHGDKYQERLESLANDMRAEVYAIADQIERERACDADTIENIRLIVGGVVDDMEHHILGHEGMDDSPVARWARELRAALGGDVRDPAADVSVSAYDLLPQEDREAIAWVREHGGLEFVMSTWENDVVLVESVIDELWNGDRPVECGNDDVMDELRRRLMPEGMEWLVEAWPRFEDGAPVRFGEEAMGFSHKPPFVVDHVTLFDGGEVTVCAEVDLDSGSVENFVRVLPGERVKRPAPKVLDADGEEIRVGDTVWDMGGNGPYEVARFTEHGYVRIKSDFGLEQSAFCERLTHRAPVLAADGRPLREGEHVYHVETGAELVVKKLPKPGEYQAVIVFALPTSPASHLTSFDPDQLTHERPDSWERIEEDAGCTATKYNERRGTIFTTKQQVARDLVRRAKKLAGVE